MYEDFWYVKTNHFDWKPIFIFDVIPLPPYLYTEVVDKQCDPSQSSNFLTFQFPR